MCICVRHPPKKQGRRSQTRAGGVWSSLARRERRPGSCGPWQNSSPGTTAAATSRTGTKRLYSSALWCVAPAHAYCFGVLLQSWPESTSLSRADLSSMTRRWAGVSAIIRQPSPPTRSSWRAASRQPPPSTSRCRCSACCRHRIDHSQSCQSILCNDCARFRFCQSNPRQRTST